jgi:hypothetical protein
VRRELDHSLEDVFANNELVVVSAISEGGIACNLLEQEDADGPVVNALIVPTAKHKLRSEVLGGTAAIYKGKKEGVGLQETRAGQVRTTATQEAALTRA